MFGKAGTDFLSGGGEMGERMRAFEWSATPLARLEDWPQSLRSALSICLGSGFQIALYWGEELCLLYNDAWSPILGTKHPEALGQPARKVWPEIWDTIGPMFAGVFATGEATRSKDALLAMHRHGFTEECYFDYTFSPIRSETGQVGGIFNAVVETTFRVIGERRTQLLRDLGDRIGDAQDPQRTAAAAATVLGAAQMDLPFSLLYLPDAVDESAFLLRGAAGCAQGVASAPPRLDSSDASIWPIGHALQTGAMLQISDLSRRFGNKILGVWPEPCERAVIVPLRIAGSATTAGILIAGLSPRLSFDAEYQAFIDRIGVALSTALSRSRAREHERQRAESLAEIDRAKTAFFSNVSHEFRTPLTLLLGPIEEALRKPTQGLSGDALESAHRNAMRLLKLVNTLLDFSRMEAGRAQAHFVPTNLAAATEELAGVFRSAMERAGLGLSIDCQPLAQPVFVDRDMWEKVVLNLLSNAFKYTFEGTIRVELRALGDGAELTVADTGTGIPSEAISQLFDRFYRVPGARGRTHEGSGIGLSLARDLVKLHGGTIEAESRLGVGTTFRVRIPFGRAHLASGQVAEELPVPAPPSSAQAYVEEAKRWLPDAQSGDQTGSFLALVRSEMPPSQPGTASNAIILLVDDSRDMREYVIRLLKPRFQVIPAEDGRHALDLIDTGVRPDLVLSDVMMPRLDGFGLLKALRANPVTENTPVIFLSARAGEEARIEGFDVGADDYLIKPFSARELITRIDTHVRLSRQRREVDQRKDVFLATLAHELRNPLAPIRNAAQVLRSPKLEPNQLQWAQTVIQRQVKHMAWLLDDLLDVARITQGKLELKRQRITLSSVLDSAVEASRPLLDSKQHQFIVSLPAEPVMLDADALRLSQVISNLLTNAAKYTDAGGHITLAGDVQDGVLSLSIKDDGIGIPPESLPAIFVMFSQVAGAAERSEGGLGIGLALVSGLVTLHGGTVMARSEGLGRGSEFIVRLPVAGPELAVTSAVDSALPPKIGRRILVADDNKDAADSLALILEMAGHEVRVVHDGRAALSLAQTFRPDVAILDIGMPHFSGYVVAEALRREPWGTDIYLMALTGWGQEADRQRAMDAGFDRHLTKPVDPDALEAALAHDGMLERGVGQPLMRE